MQTLVGIGALAILCTAMGGADVMARSAAAAFFDTDAWWVTTSDGTNPQTRISVTGGATTGRVRIQNSNIELASQNPLPTATEGSLGYDSSGKKFKYHNGTAWTEPGAEYPKAYIEGLVLKVTSSTQVDVSAGSCRDRLAIEAQLEPGLTRRQRLVRLAKPARIIGYHQWRNRRARKCHRKTALRKLRRKGIIVSKLRSCHVILLAL